MEEKLSGIVLGGISYGESDKILKIFTLEKGTVSARIKGVKKAGAKLKFASEPFCFAEFVFSCSLNKRTVIGASLIDSFYPIREDIKRYFAGGAILEFIKKFFKEEIVSQEIFLITMNALKELAYGNTDEVKTLATFLVKGLNVAGFGLNLFGCRECGKEFTGRVYFDAGLGGFLCEDCFSGIGREINPKTYFALKDVLLGKTVEKEFAVKSLKLLEYYLQFKTDESLKSLSELIKLEG